MKRTILTIAILMSLACGDLFQDQQAEDARQAAEEARLTEEARPSTEYPMKKVNAGTDTIGCTPGQSDCNDDETAHDVTLTYAYMIGETEVTQGLWSSVMGSNPASGKDYEGVSLEGPEYPVVYVRWCDAVVFANALSAQNGLEAAYTLPSGFSASMSADRCNELSGSVRWNRSANGYRLPTEAEWEYAGRAGGQSVYSGTSEPSEMCGYGNVSNPSVKSKFDWSHPVFPCEDGHTTLAPVGSFAPNGWDLYDMSGNVWEWCWDWYGNYPANANVDPLGPSNGSYRVARGSSWRGGPADVRLANRVRFTPSRLYNGLGLRLVRSL